MTMEKESEDSVKKVYAREHVLRAIRPACLEGTEESAVFLQRLAYGGGLRAALYDIRLVPDGTADLFVVVDAVRGAKCPSKKPGLLELVYRSLSSNVCARVSFSVDVRGDHTFIAEPRLSRLLRVGFDLQKRSPHEFFVGYRVRDSPGCGAGGVVYAAGNPRDGNGSGSGDVARFLEVAETLESGLGPFERALLREHKL